MKVLSAPLTAGPQQFAIVASRFNDFIVNRLVEGATDALRRHGVASDKLTLVWVPGAWEIALAARRLAAAGTYGAVICLGCVIRGQTPHFEYVAGEAAKGIAAVAMNSGIPVTFGVVTADTLEQAIDRAGGKAGNKGAEAALAALEMTNLLDLLPK